MAPSTRSGGVPPPSRVYHSTPPLHQAQFPARRVTKTYGKKATRAPEPKQSTLTQLNWAASSGDPNPVIEFSDSEDDVDEEEEKENGEEEEEEEDAEPVASGRGRRQRKQAVKQTFFEDDPPSGGKKRRPSSSAPAQNTDKSKSKRRRTMGDEIPQNARRAPGRGRAAEKGRRKTMDDVPSPQNKKKKYHTQTITQVVRDFVKDSEDEDEGNDQEFDEWVGAPSPSPRKPRRSQNQTAEAEVEAQEEKTVEPQLQSRQESIVPQTPAKKQIRFEIPSSTQSSKGMLSANALERYGPADQPQVTPSKGNSKMDPISELPGDASSSRTLKSAIASGKKLVIEDSFATDSWGSTSTKRSPLKDVTAMTVPSEQVAEEQPEEGEDQEDQATPRAPPSLSRESSSVADAMSTPSKPPRRRGGSMDLGRNPSPSPRKPTSPEQTTDSASAPGKKSMSNVLEIPDSEDEDEDEDDGFWGEEEVTTQDQRVDKGQEKQSEEPQPKDETTEAPVEESVATEESEPAVSEEKPHEDENIQNSDTFVVGAETQGAFDELTMSLDTTPRAPTTLGTINEDDEERIPQSTAASQSDHHISQSPIASARRTTRSKTSSQQSPAAPKLPPPPKAARPLRRPIRHPVAPSSPTQFIESQRVPLSVIQALGDVTAQTDAFVLAPPAQIDDLASGHRIDLSLDHNLPNAVVRIWLFGSDLLRYVACVGPGTAASGKWTFNVDQVYELNNPLDESDIVAEDWFNRFPRTWAKLPPVVVSQLLSNLKHALFNPDDNDDNLSTQDTTQQDQPCSSPRQLPPHSSRRTKTTTPSASFSSASVSQQLEAQLRSETEQYTQSVLPALPSDDDIVIPSTPVHHRTKTSRSALPPPPPPAFPSSSTSKRLSSARKTPRLIQPSQATTASQASSPDDHHSHPRKLPPPTPVQRAPPMPESSSLHFIDLDSPPVRPPNSSSGETIPISQLLTKSQMLPESLLADDVNMPPRMEMWASDEEA